MLLYNLSPAHPAHLDPILPMVVQVHPAKVVEDRVISVINDIVGDHRRQLHMLQGREGEEGEGRGVQQRQ